MPRKTATMDSAGSHPSGSRAPKSSAGRSRASRAGCAAAPQSHDRQRMIAERAYFRAESRGFQGGDAVIDWLEAEREVERILGHAPAGSRTGRKAGSERLEE